MARKVKLPVGIGAEMNKKIPAAIERSIITPHEHEGKGNKPLWLIWKVESSSTGVPYFPVLDSVCDSARSCRYHVLMILDENERRQLAWSDTLPTDVYVERIPANHRFGSSLPQWQMNSHMAIWKARNTMRTGD